MSAPRLRVVVPARDEAEHLPRLLDSLRRADPEGTALEVVVVDHGSADATAGLAVRHGARVLPFDGATIAAARNAGAEGAATDHLCFLDADCSVETGWLEAVLAALEQTDVVAVGSYPRAPEAGSTWVQRAWSELVRRPGPARPTSWLPSANLAVRRADFEAVGGFDAGLRTCEDADLCYRLARRGRILYDPATTVRHHREPVDLVAFHAKEVWHGGDTYRRLARQGLDRQDLPSLLLPVVNFVSWLLVGGGAVLAVAGGSRLPLLLGGAGVVGLPLLLTLRALAGGRPILWAPRFFALYAVYLAARTRAMLVRSGREAA